MIFPPYAPPDRTALDFLADLLLIGAGLGVFTFTLCYMVLFKWHKTPAGIAVLGFTMALSLVLGLMLASKFTGGEYVGRDAWRVVVYGSNLVAAWGMVTLLFYSRRRGEKPLHLVERESTKRRSQLVKRRMTHQKSPDRGGME